jgi:cGMP-dependent protein kinase
MQLIRTFKDNHQVYFLTEFIPGMELFDVIRDIGLLSDLDNQFYIGSMLLSLEYLHNKFIIYRDIKPENILVDNLGIMKLIDLGTAKKLDEKKNARTFTIIGTPHYMAPEIITGKGYSFSVDLWSVGICMYEFLCGRVPFGEDAEDPYEIYEEVLRNKLVYPAFYKNKLGKKLMEQLMSKLIEVRLGEGYHKLKKHPYFENTDWLAIMKKQQKPPFVPPKDNNIDKNLLK